MMRVILITVAAVVLLGALAVAGLRASGVTLPWESSICGDPTASCWTHGRPVYLAMVRRGFKDTVATAMSDKIVTTRILNTGPDIPRLVAVTSAGKSGRVLRSHATLATADGTRSIVPRLLSRRNHTYMWSLGPVPDGSVLTLVQRCRPYTSDQSWMQPALYGRLSANGKPRPADILQHDSASLQS